MALLSNHILTFCSLFFVILSVSLCFASRADMKEDQIKVAEFDVKPGGTQHTYEQEWDGFTCKFTYVCQGGTSEKWLVGVTRNNEMTEYQCIVERTGGISYLFFQEFKMEVSGVQLVEVGLFESGVELQSKEYTVNYEKNYVEQRIPDFQSKLSKIEVYGTKSHEEL